MHSLEELVGHLRLSEEAVADADIAGRFAARSRLHDLIQHGDLDPAALAATVNEMPGACFGSRVSGVAIDAIKKGNQVYKITFPSCEPIDTAALIAMAITEIYDFAPLEGLPPILFATDCEYRPHGSIGMFEDGTYHVILSRYLLLDLFQVCHVVSEVALSAALRTGREIDILRGLSSGEFIESFKAGPWFDQAPYILSALAACEKYRFGLRTNDSTDLSVPGAFHGLAIAFLIAHELAHIANGDFGDSGQTPLLPARLMERIIRSHSDPTLSEFFDAETVRQFWERCGESYLREFAADFRATVICTDLARRFLGSEEAGFAAAAAALSALAWADRAECYQQIQRDPLKLVGKQIYNRVSLGVDVALFQRLDGWEERGHPWGKTRVMILGIYISIFQHLNIGNLQSDAARAMVQNIAGIFVWSMPEALALLKWIHAKSGEFIAAPYGEDMLLTIHAETVGGVRRTFQYHTRLCDLYGLRDCIELD